MKEMPMNTNDSTPLQPSNLALLSHLPKDLTSTLPRSFGKCLNPTDVIKPQIRTQSKDGSPRLEMKSDAIITHAKNAFSSTGQLKIDGRGFVYLDISDEIIFDLFAILDNSNTTIPPYFGDNLYGAHISVVLASESRLNAHINLIGKELPFTITGCYSVEPENWEEVERVWFLTIDSPELSLVRTKLGLEPKIMNHDFHITFAIQKRFFSIDDLLISEKQDKIVIDNCGTITKNRIRDLRNARNRA